MKPQKPLEANSQQSEHRSLLQRQATSCVHNKTDRTY